MFKKRQECMISLPFNIILEVWVTKVKIKKTNKSNKDWKRKK